jgi:hypothetical protein
MIYMWFTGINYSKLAVEKDLARLLFLRPCIKRFYEASLLYRLFSMGIRKMNALKVSESTFEAPVRCGDW